DQELIKDYLDDIKISYEEFHNNNNNLQKLRGKLKYSPIRGNKILLVHNYLSLGNTVNTKFIGMWWEREGSKRSNADTLAQRVGRCCGYGKENDEFPIYCNIDKIKEAAQ